MWVTEVSFKTTATKEEIWKLWKDVFNWNIWDEDVKKSELLGEFKKGTKGVLKPASGPKTKFEIIECTAFKSFTNRSYLPLCKIDFIHTLTELPSKVEITHKVEISGYLSFVFSKIIGAKIKVQLPIAVNKLIELAEKKESL